MSKNNDIWPPVSQYFIFIFITLTIVLVNQTIFKESTAVIEGVHSKIFKIHA